VTISGRQECVAEQKNTAGRADCFLQLCFFRCIHLGHFFSFAAYPPRSAIEGRLGTGKTSLLRRRSNFLERGCGGANSFGVGRAGETVGSRELGRIEDIWRVVLVEHFIDFTD
jgi:hypothetical protein